VRRYRVRVVLPWRVTRAALCRAGTGVRGKRAAANRWESGVRGGPLGRRKERSRTRDENSRSNSDFRCTPYTIPYCTSQRTTSPHVFIDYRTGDAERYACTGAFYQTQCDRGVCHVRRGDVNKIPAIFWHLFVGVYPSADNAAIFVGSAIRARAVKIDRCVSGNALSAEKCFLIDERAGKIYHLQRALHMHVLMCTIFILPVRDNMYKRRSSFTCSFRDARASRNAVSSACRSFLDTFVFHFSLKLSETAAAGNISHRRVQSIGILPVTIIDEGSDRFATSWKINGRRKVIRFQNGLSVCVDRRPFSFLDRHWLSSRESLVGLRDTRALVTRSGIAEIEIMSADIGGSAIISKSIGNSLAWSDHVVCCRDRTDEAWTGNDRSIDVSIDVPPEKQRNVSRRECPPCITPAWLHRRGHPSSLHPFRPRASQSDRQLLASSPT